VLRAEIEQRRENFERAMEHISESIEISQEVAADLELLHAVEWQAVFLARQGKTEQAIRLFAATEAQRERAGAPVPQGERAALDQERAALRTIGDPQAFTVSWEMGRNLSWDATIASARELARSVKPKELV
jgi:hypothetical protein